MANDRICRDKNNKVIKCPPKKKKEPTRIGQEHVSRTDYTRLGELYGEFKTGDENARKYSYVNQGDDFIDPQTGKRHRFGFLQEEGNDEKSLGIGQRVRDARAKADALADADHTAFRTRQEEGYNALSETQRGNRTRNLANALSKGGRDRGEISDILKKYTGRSTAAAGGFTPDERAQVTNYLESHGDGANLQALYSRAGKLEKQLKQDAIDQNAAGIEKAVTPEDSPLNRNSPLNQGSINFQNLAQGAPIQNYATQSARIGQSVDDAVAQNQQRELRERKAKEDALRSEMLHNQYQEQKVQQLEKFIVPGDTGFNQVDAAINTTSRGLVDRQSELVAAAKRGDISPDDLAYQTAQLRSQVPALKNFKSTLTANIQDGAALVAGNQVSKATSPETLALYQALQDPNGDAELVIGDDGNVMFKGTFLNPATGEQQPFDIPAAGINQMPKLTAKADPPEKVLKPAMAELNKQFTEFNDAAETQIRASFDDLAGDDKVLKSLAADYFGDIEFDSNGDGVVDDADQVLSEMTSNDLDNLLTQPAPEGSDNNNLLEHLVEDAYVGRARTYFEEADFTRRKQDADLKLREAQALNAQRLANKAASGDLTANQQLQQEQIRNVNAFVDNTISGALGDGSTEVDAGKLQALTDGKIQSIEYYPSEEKDTSLFGGVFGQKLETTPEEFEIFIKGEKEPRIVNRDQLAQVVKQIKLGTKTF